MTADLAQFLRSDAGRPVADAILRTAAAAIEVMTTVRRRAGLSIAELMSGDPSEWRRIRSRRSAMRAQYRAKKRGR